MFKTNIKVISLAVGLLVSGASIAADNSIYIDQAGNNSTITMTQDGAGNKVKGILLNGTAGGITDVAKLIGDAQTIKHRTDWSHKRASVGCQYHTRRSSYR